MSQSKEIKSSTQIIIPGGNNKQYEVNLAGLSEFLDTCFDLQLDDIASIELVLENIADMVVENANEDLKVSEIKTPLMLLRNLRFMLDMVFCEVE